jgi:hypothetical protein
MTNLKIKADMEFARYLIEILAPDLRAAGNTYTAEDIEDAGHRLLHASEILEGITP